MPPKQLAFVSSTISTVSNHLKPHKAEAIQRIRTNGLCLVATLILSYILPIPSVPAALRSMFWASNYQRWSAEWVWEWACLLEVGVLSLLVYNIVEAAYAIKYPRKPLPPVTSPAKAKMAATPMSTPQRSFKILSPSTSPQVQKPFAFSPGASTSLASASIALSNSAANKSYAQSPVSTPSRVLNYTLPPSASTNTQASSTSEYLATPSPVVSAYRGKHSGIDVGRALDGSYLLRITPNDVEDD